MIRQMLPSIVTSLALAIPAPASGTDLHDPSLDYTYIMIAHDSLYTAVLPLRDHRENDYCGNFTNTHRVIAVTRSEVESQFGGGPSGIKDFLTYAHDNWAAAPEYVLLVGDGDYVEAYDDTLMWGYCCDGKGPDPVCSDDWYGCVDGPLDVVPDMVIARLPARSPAEVEAYVSKVLTYDESRISRAANRNFLYLCQDYEYWDGYKPTASQVRLVRDDLTTSYLSDDWTVTVLTASEVSSLPLPECYPAWEAAVLAKINDSPMGDAPGVVGGIARASGFYDFMNFLEINLGFDMSKITAPGVMALFVGTSCRQGASTILPGCDPSLRTMADVLLFEPYKGAIGLIGPTEGSHLHDNYWFSQALFSRLRDPDKTIGKAFLEAKIECLQAYDFAEDTTREYSLLGDPVLVLTDNYEPEISGVAGRSTVDPGEVRPLEVFFEDRNLTCRVGGGYSDEIWSIDWEAELGTVVEDEGWPVVPHTATYYAPDDVSGVYDHVTVTVTDKMGLTDVWVKDIYIKHYKPGCPYLYVYDGESFRRDNNVSAWAYSGGGGRQATDDFYMLRVKPGGNEWVLEIRGLEQETSFFDEVSLLTVDHDSSLDIAMTPDGSLFPYRGLRPPVSAVDGSRVDRLSAVRSEDGLSYEGRKGDFLVLTFDSPGQLVLSAEDGSGGGGGVVLGGDGKVDPCVDGGCYGGDMTAEGVPNLASAPLEIPKGIVVQVPDGNGQWVEASFMRPREHLSEMVIPKSALLRQGVVPGSVRLYWTGDHSLDFVGYVERSAETPDVRAVELTEAIHTSGRPVLDALAGEDGESVTVAPGEKVRLVFKPDPLPEGKERDLILVTRGYFTRGPDSRSTAEMSLPLMDDLEFATPNPFTSDVAVHYTISAPGSHVTIQVFDAGGRLVRTLVRETKPPGRHTATWDGRTAEGRVAPAGIYFCRMSARDRTVGMKIIKSK